MNAADGSIFHARGIDISNNPIGENLYIQTFLTNKLDSICEEIKQSSDCSAVRLLKFSPDLYCWSRSYEHKSFQMLKYRYNNSVERKNFKI